MDQSQFHIRARAMGLNVSKLRECECGVRWPAAASGFWAGHARLCPDSQDSVLTEAERVLSGPRQDAYGDPVETCERIGRAWGALLGLPDIEPRTVALMMAALKGVRELSGTGSQRDNFVDGAAYHEIAARAAESESDEGRTQ